MTLSSRTRKKVQFYAATVIFGVSVGGCTVPNFDYVETVSSRSASGHYIQAVHGESCTTLSFRVGKRCEPKVHFVVVTDETARDSSNAYGVGGPRRFDSLATAQAHLDEVTAESLPVAPREPTVVEETEEALNEAVAATEADTAEAEALEQANEAADNDINDFAD